MRPLTYALLAAPVVLAGLVWLQLSTSHAREFEHARNEQILARKADVERLVSVTLEEERARDGRYPEKLTTSLFPDPLFTWYYSVSEGATDYELWCALPAVGEGRDALVFSPDGSITKEWPADRSSDPSRWTVVKRVDLAPTARAAQPFIPQAAR